MTTKFILAGIESTYGTDPTLSESSDSILTTGLDLTPLETDNIERNLDVDEVGNTEVTLASKRGSLTYSVEAQGAGGSAGDTVVPYGVLLRSAGFAETIDTTSGSENVSYDLVDNLDSLESCFIYVFWNGKLHKLAGVRQSMSINCPSRDIMRFGFSGTGIYVTPTETSPSAADFTSFKDPLEVNSSNTSITIDSFSPEMESLEIDIAHPVNYISRVGAELVDLANPEPTGTLVIKTPSLSSFNPFSLAEAGTKQAFTLTHGTADGLTVEVQLDEVQLLEPSYVDLDDEGDGISIPINIVGSGIRVITR